MPKEKEHQQLIKNISKSLWKIFIDITKEDLNFGYILNKISKDYLSSKRTNEQKKDFNLKF
ncbi:MAG: hypothetical protein U9Q06_04190 [Nanoarchaeota archaeon]|nr:hypothetical protein [Nanoarchaeota archaeon]